MISINHFLLLAMRFLQSSWGILCHSSMHIFSSSAIFFGFLARTLRFRVAQRFSIGLRSGSWAGHVKTSILFFSSHFFTILLVCWKSPLCIYRIFCHSQTYSWWMKILSKNIMRVILVHCTINVADVSWLRCTEASPAHKAASTLFVSRERILRWESLSLSLPIFLNIIVVKQFNFCVIWPWNSHPVRGSIKMPFLQSPTWPWDDVTGAGESFLDNSHAVQVHE